MTLLNFQEAQVAPVYKTNSVPSPAGWVTTGIHVINLNARDKENSEAASQLNLNLSQAARLTEQLIDALKDGISIDVPVSYMRVEENAIFHILLLIKDADFHSPKIVSARIMAEKFANVEGLNIRFVFAIESENRMNNAIKFGGYKLMHNTDPQNNNETH